MIDQQQAIQMKAYLIGLTLKELETSNKKQLVSDVRETQRTQLTKLRKQIKELLEICGVTELEA